MLMTVIVAAAALFTAVTGMLIGDSFTFVIVRDSGLDCLLGQEG